MRNASKKRRVFTWNTARGVVRGRRVFAAAVCAALAYALTACADDEVQLKNGGRFTGKITPSATDDGSEIRVVTSDGISVTFAETDVKDITFTGPGAEAYEKELAKTPNTPEGNLRLAEWCLKNGVASRQKIHLRRVLEIDPDNAEARKKLGYRRSVDGNWYTLAEEMAAQGKVLHNGRWMSSQERDLLVARREAKTDVAKYTKLIAQWRKDLTGKKSAEARANFTALVDPLAVKGLITAWEKEKTPQMKQIYIAALGRIGSIEARACLRQAAVDDPSEDIRLACVDELRRYKDKAVTDYFVSRLTPKRSSNVQLNNAARALGEIGDRTAIPALIDALTTTHKYQMTTGSNPGQMSATMGGSSQGGGGAGLSMGNKPQIVQKTHQNKDVLQALERMTGVNFLYDKTAWLQWLKNNHVPGPLEAR